MLRGSWFIRSAVGADFRIDGSVSVGSSHHRIVERTHLQSFAVCCLSRKFFLLHLPAFLPVVFLRFFKCIEVFYVDVYVGTSSSTLSVAVGAQS